MQSCLNNNKPLSLSILVRFDQMRCLRCRKRSLNTAGKTLRLSCSLERLMASIGISDSLFICLKEYETNFPEEQSIALNLVRVFFSPSRCAFQQKIQERDPHLISMRHQPDIYKFDTSTSSILCSLENETLAMVNESDTRCLPCSSALRY